MIFIIYSLLFLLMIVININIREVVLSATENRSGKFVYLYILIFLIILYVICLFILLSNLIDYLKYMLAYTKEEIRLHKLKKKYPHLYKIFEDEKKTENKQVRYQK